jgi:hypothetical protein
MSKEEREEKARARLAADPLPPSPYLVVKDDQILIKCGFSEQLLQLLRWVPRVEWRQELRAWSVPITGAETLRGVLPEVLRLAEATEEIEARAPVAETGTLSKEDLFRSAARLLFGSDWQRETARALGRDEAALARFLLGERTLEDSDRLYGDMLALMQRRAGEISQAADRFASALAQFASHEEKAETPAAPSSPDQGM